MTRVRLRRVSIGQDVYIGTAEEVVAFMARAEGAPPGEGETYMRGVATRVRERLDLGPVDTSSAEAFLDDLAELGLLRQEAQADPSDERVDPRAFVGGGPLAYSGDSDLADLDLEDL